MLLDDLYQRKLIKPPKWLVSNCQYLTIHGSIAYGVYKDTSDFDCLGWTIQQKESIFPHLAGCIPGFGNQIEPFNQWQEHHIYDKDAQGGTGREYDFKIYGIVNFFNLLMNNNPDAIESLFTAQDCVLHCSQLGQKLRDERKCFLHKGIIPRLRGYAFSQLNKAKSQERIGKRAEDVEKYGYDIKFLYHVYRLALQAEQILQTGDLDLRRDREMLKAVRRGEISLDETQNWFTEKEIQLQKLYDESKLPWGPNEGKVKQILLDILETHYGNLEKAVNNINKAEDTLREIKRILDERGF